MSFEDEFEKALNAANWPKRVPPAFSIVKFRATDNRQPKVLQDVAFGIAAGGVGDAPGSATVDLTDNDTTLTCSFSRADQAQAGGRGSPPII